MSDLCARQYCLCKPDLSGIVKTCKKFKKHGEFNLILFFNILNFHLTTNWS